MSTQYTGILTSWRASTAMFVYEVIITFDQEIKLVWSYSWSLPKCLYLLARYFGLGTSIMNIIITSSSHSNQFCRVYTPIFTLCTFITQAAPDGLLVLRVLSLLTDKPWLSRMVYGTYFALIVVEIGVVAFEFVMTFATPPNGLDDYGCFTSGGNRLYVDSIIGGTLLTFNTFLFFITLMTMRPRWHHGVQFTSFVEVLIRDGSVYFALICLVLVLLTITPISMYSLGWIFSIPAIATCRMFLNLRCISKNSLLDTTVQSADVSRPIFNVATSSTAVEDQDVLELTSVREQESTDGKSSSYV